MSIIKPGILKIFALLIVFFLMPELADAHRVNLFAYVEDGTVYVESKFSGGKEVKGGQIIVTDPQGVELVKGTTDSKGKFFFKIPKKTDLKIVLLAGTGHRAEWIIPVGEIEMPATAKKPVQAEGPTVPKIILGLACILGIAAIGRYLKNRRDKQKGAA